MGCGASTKDSSSKADSSAGGGAADKKPTAASEIKKDNVKAGGIVHAGFIIDNPGKISEFYDLDKKKLGEGSYGSVSKCKAKTTGVTRACKTISKNQMKNLDRFKAEIAIMKIMDHPNIIKLYESFEDHKNIYLILELCTGGELFDRIIDAGHFTEQQAAVTLQHMFRAVFYMHENHICHRDLKPENFLFTSKEPVEKCLLKVIDFGLACKFAPGKQLTTKAGTPYYVAPQVLAGKYDHLSDVWSLGVIMFVLLCGYPPFYGENDNEVLQKVRLGQFTFNQADWKNISQDAKDLIKNLLKMDPKTRYTAQQALEHTWVKNKAPKAKEGALPTNMMSNLKGFRSQNKLKKAALHVIASQLDESKIKALRETFMQLDGNGDGLLNAAEMKEGLTKAGLAEIPPDLQQILESCDSDGSGVIDYTEFLAATLDKAVYQKEEIVWQAFRLFDRNGDGKISKDELKYVLNDDGVQEAAKDMAELMKEIDQNGDGEIDFNEFMAMMRAEGGGGKGGSLETNTA